jgi:hypothetical protein
MTDFCLTLGAIMRSTILAAIAIFFVLPALAEFKVNKVSPSGGRAILNGTDGLMAGDNVVYTDEFKEECVAKVISTDKKETVIDYSRCPNASAIKVGVVFTKAAPQPVVEPTARFQEERKDPGLSSRNENWYTYWALGGGPVAYNDDVKRELENADDMAGYERDRMAFDFFGFYWPLADFHAMHGFVVSGMTDSVTNDIYEYSVDHFIYSYSYMQFYGTNIGDGWFIRGDVGFAKYIVVRDLPLTAYSDTTDNGIGIVGGGGYAWPISDETRFLLGAYLSHVSADGEKANSLTLKAGFLW